MHADRPGDRPRLLYWYRTAPGITLGRSPLDEDAIRAIEEQYPDIDFDWPAILALSEVMTPEDEAAPKTQSRDREPRRERRPRREPEAPRAPQRGPGREAESASAPESAFAGEQTGPLRRDEPGEESAGAAEPGAVTELRVEEDEVAPVEAPRAEAAPRTHHSNLVDQLAGREIASRLRGRYAEMSMRIRDAEAPLRESLMTRAEALDPDRWDTPEAVLQGVSNADAIFEQLRAALAAAKP